MNLKMGALNNKAFTNNLPRFIKRLNQLINDDNLNEQGQKIIYLKQSYQGIVYFLNNFKHLETIEFDMYLNDNGKFALQSPIRDTFFYIEIADKDDVNYNICNEVKNHDIVKKGSIDGFFEDFYNTKVCC
jgi:hypothetical protein